MRILVELPQSNNLLQVKHVAAQYTTKLLHTGGGAMTAHHKSLKMSSIEIWNTLQNGSNLYIFGKPQDFVLIWLNLIEGNAWCLQEKMQETKAPTLKYFVLSLGELSFLSPISMFLASDWSITVGTTLKYMHVYGKEPWTNFHLSAGLGLTCACLYTSDVHPTVFEATNRSSLSGRLMNRWPWLRWCCF